MSVRRKAVGPEEAPAWPRIYRPKRGWRLVGGVGGVLLIGIAAVCAVVMAVELPGIALWFVPLMCLPMAALGALGCGGALRDRIVLFDHAIEIHHFPFRHRVVARDDIVGRRSLPPPHGLTLVFELRAGQKPAKTQKVWQTDAVLDAWMSSLRDLDAEDLARSEAELLAKPALGLTEADRAHAIDSAGRVGCGLIAVVLATAGGAWFYPHPHSVVIVALVLLPVIVIMIAATGRGLFWFGDDRNDARISLTPALALPGMVLAIRAFVDHSMIDHVTALTLAAVGALTLGFVMMFVDVGVRGRWQTGIFWTLLLWPYAWGAVVEANVLLDRGEGETIAVEVLSKHVTTGRGGGAFVELPAWGPHTERSRYRVTAALHEAVDVGELVCARLHDGALGARWYTVDRCP